MNKSRKIMSLLLVLVLALPMVFMTVNALADTVNVVKTSGGVLNVWPQPKKVAGSSTKSLKNGTVITLSGDKTYSTADKRWMVYITAPVAGWVDQKYVGKKDVVPAKPLVVKSVWDAAELQGTAPNSIINLWDGELNKKGNKPLMAALPLGYVFTDVVNWSDGWSFVTFKTADLKEVSGYVQTRYLVNLTPVTP